MTLWTYVGQIVNFLVFVLILYLLLYKPIRRMMQQRKDEMEAGLRQAEKKLQQAEKIRAQAEKSAQELEEKRDAVLKEARDQAETQRQELLARAEQQARDRLQRFRRIMEQERGEVLDKVTDELRDTIVQVAASVLADTSIGLADAGIARLEKLLEEMSEEDLQSARKALGDLENHVRVRTASALDDDQVKRLKKILGNKLGIEKVELKVSEDPSLLAGLEVMLGHINLEAHWRGVIDRALQQPQKAPKK